MPDLVPVDHDPFASAPQFVPVDHDPFAVQSMTHQPEQPNPAAPYLNAAKNIAGSGLAFATGGLKGAGVDVLPDWMNTFGSVFQNPDNAAAIGAIGPAGIARMGEMLADGATQRQIADELKASLGDVQRTIRKEGLPTNPSRGAPVKQIGEFTAPESSIDKLVKSLFKAPNSATGDLYPDKSRQLRRRTE
jgi:hypothetical protein